MHTYVYMSSAMYLPYLIAFPVFALCHLRSNSHPLFISDTLSRIYILFLFSHTLLILLFICPSVHIYLQTWHATHKSPFRSAYFSHALEFFFLPPSVTLPSLTLRTITHSVFYCSTFIFKNASKFPSYWHCRPLSPMPSG